MMALKSFFLGLIMIGMPLPVSAQIITQNPHPEVQVEETHEVETLNRNERVGRAGTLIKIPRTAALLFAGFNTNSDYIIDVDEVKAGIEIAFVRADKDKSGSLSLVELEGWRLAALGSNHASPTNYDFAPNFARTVDKAKFTEVVYKIAEKLDTDDQGVRDGRIAMADLLKDFRPPRGQTDDSQCQARIRELRRQNQQQCRTNRGY